MMTILFTAVLLLPFGMSVGQVPSSAPSLDAEASSLRQFSNQLKPKFGKVRFHRDEQLEDRLRTRRSAPFLN
jgi:hypothetical protein